MVVFARSPSSSRRRRGHDSRTWSKSSRTEGSVERGNGHLGTAREGSFEIFSGLRYIHFFIFFPFCSILAFARKFVLDLYRKVHRQLSSPGAGGRGWDHHHQVLRWQKRKANDAEKLWGVGFKNMRLVLFQSSSSSSSSMTEFCLISPGFIATAQSTIESSSKPTEARQSQEECPDTWRWSIYWSIRVDGNVAWCSRALWLLILTIYGICTNRVQGIYSIHQTVWI